MGVATHLGIDLAEYDVRIRTFIPYYAEMLDAAAAVVPARTRGIVDLGVGTGALAARCIGRARKAQVSGIDADEAILRMAAARLPGAHLVRGNFLRRPIPAADVVVSSFALHHVRTRAAKAGLFDRVRRALRPGGLFVGVDCHPSRDRADAAREHRAWHAHLRRAYPPREAAALLAAWAKEDVYTPLDVEIALLERAGFGVDVVWRRDAFAVLRAVRRR